MQSCAHDLASREGGRWETKRFIGMALHIIHYHTLPYFAKSMENIL